MTELTRVPVAEAGAPLHHERPMYRDEHDGTDMLRWLCTEPGCAAALAEDTLAGIREMAWADEHGILLPGVTIINVGTTGSTP